MEGQNIAPFEQLIHIDTLYRRIRDVGIVGNHGHADCRRLPCDGLRQSAGTEQTEGELIDSLHRSVPQLVPNARRNIVMGSDHAMHRCENRRERMIADFLDTIVGNIGDYDAACSSGRQIYIVHAAPQPRHYPAGRHAFEHRRIHSDKVDN